jgi:hypothetical protein
MLCRRSDGDGHGIASGIVENSLDGSAHCAGLGAGKGQIDQRTLTDLDPGFTNTPPHCLGRRNHSNAVDAQLIGN